MSSALSRSKAHLYAAEAAGIAVLLLTLLSFAVPFVRAVTPAFTKGGSGSAYGIGDMLRIFGYTLCQALCSTLIALLAGFPAAYFTAKKEFPGRRLLLSFSALPLCVPAFITALGFIMTFGMNGIVNRLLLMLGAEEPPVTFLYSFAGVVITQGFYNFPIVMATVSGAWSSLDTVQEDAARMLGARPSAVFRTVTLPRLVPAVCSGCIPVFLFCFFSFMIVLMFGSAGGTTFEVAIYQAGRITLDFTGCARLALLETGTAIIILASWSLAQRHTLRSTGISVMRGAGTRKRLTRRDAVPFTVFCAAIVLFFVLPFGSLLVPAISPSTWRALGRTRSFFLSLRNTALLSAASACTCTAAALAYALLTMRRRDSTLTGTLAMLPMAVSSVVMGIGFAATARRASFLTLVLAQSALFWPFAYRQIKSHIEKIPRGTVDGARLLSVSHADAVFRVYIPLSRKGIRSALFLTAAMSAGDATLPLILSPQDFPTLSLLTYRLAGSYRLSESCVCALLLGALCMLLFTLGKSREV